VTVIRILRKLHCYIHNDKELTPDVGPFDGAPKGDRDGCEVEGLREGCLVG
jgi:hypothetical protein